MPADRRRGHAVLVRLNAREKAALAWLVASYGTNANAVVRTLIVQAADQPTKEND